MGSRQEGHDDGTRRRRRRVTTVLVVVGVAVWLGGGALLTLDNRERIEADLRPDCPSGRVLVTVASYDTAPLTGAVPGSDPLFTLDVTFDVVNDTSAAVEINYVHAGVAGAPDTEVKAYGSGPPVGPGDTTTLTGQVTVEGIGLTPPPPDPATTGANTSWADDGLTACDPPSDGRID